MDQKLIQLFEQVKTLYKVHKEELLFHGRHHIHFVYKKSLLFAKSNWANEFLVWSAALVHDLNYIVKKNSDPEDWFELLDKIFANNTYSDVEIKEIKNIVVESHTAYRSEKISLEWAALSDGDTLFKVLPITPILFSSKYITENNIDIKKLSEKIASEQNKLLESWLFFYTQLANERYLPWAEDNLKLWRDVASCLWDEDIQVLIEGSRV